MTSFLEYVATDLLAKYGTNLSRLAVVFPNKRAALFLNEYLARQAGQPLWSPAYITISDLFRSQSNRQVADPIKLICDLHKSFTACTGIDETLDHFYGWGQLLLSDFDDVDKNMAPADRVFANLRDIHELDDVSYLSPEQKDIIRRFFSNFSEEHNSELKRRFLQLWSHIGHIYHDFNLRLDSQGLAYEGALYREVVQREGCHFEYDTYIFIGFNLLHQVEQTLFRRLRQAGKARFYWDFDHYYTSIPQKERSHGWNSEAGHYISQYLADFPNELDNYRTDIYGNFAQRKRITFISAPTENIQARYVSTWLQKGNRINDGRRTAIVLANEGLLQTITHSLPDTVEKVNITTGYPLSQTPVASFVAQLFALYIYGYDRQRDSFRLHYINHLLRHPYVRYISDASQELYKNLNTNKIYYPNTALLSGDEGLSLLFSLSGQETDNTDILRWMMAIVRRIATTVEQPSPITQESLFRMYTLLNRLVDLTDCGDLTVDIITLQRLVNQVITATTIPFHGEPAEGLQVMGVLETRNLDFDHVLLLSCNEGNLPRGVSDTSFIPYSIRKAYGLTTVDHKVAIYAYYFHRLLQRATDVTLVYNNATSDGQTGEMSRFMLQLMVESGHHVNFQTLQAGQKSTIRTPHAIDKTDAVMELLFQRFRRIDGEQTSSSPMLTPTAINRYMRCPLQFFYRYVSGILEPDDDEEDTIDNRIFGNIFHLAAQLIYKKLMERSSLVKKTDIELFLKTEVDIERAVDEAFKRELFQIHDPQRPIPPYDGIQLINREVIIKYVRQLLEIDIRLTPFTILGLEKLVTMDYVVNKHLTVTLGGTIDRLDVISFPDGSERIRVIDYKTGSGRLKAIADVEAIFAKESLKNHSDYYLQTFLYSHIVRRSSGNTPVSPALLFIQHAGTEDYDPTLLIGREPVTDIANVEKAYIQLLGEKIKDIFSPTIPFTPTDDRQRCKTCPYAGLCGI